MNIIKKIWRKIPKTIRSILIFMFVMSAISGLKNGLEGDSSNDKTSVNQVAKAEQEEVILQTTAINLFNAYDENEVATDEKIKGAIIEITGFVQSIDKDFTGSIIINLETNNEYMPVRLTMEKSEKEIAMNLRKGKKIKARCKRVSRMMGAPNGSKCTFVK
jgi:hypothetical protein